MNDRQKVTLESQQTEPEMKQTSDFYRPAPTKASLEPYSDHKEVDYKKLRDEKKMGKS